jgi:ABC-type phosphate transport system ATPase subunit
MKYTYRQAIELEIKALDKVYDIAGALRDTAIGVEKDVFNQIRGNVGEVASQLRTLNNRMADHRAAIQLEGNYDIKITIDDL